MTAADVRNWLRIFLVLTFIIGGYILLFAGTPLLPIDRTEGSSAIQIIFPTLIAQITTMFRWYRTDANKSEVTALINTPVWTIKLPPMMVLCLLSATVIAMIVGNHQGALWAPSAETFKAILTFSVSILAASTAFIVSRFFGSGAKR